MKARAQSRGPRLISSPGLHFLLLGSALFFGQGWLERHGSPVESLARVLDVDPARVAQLSLQWQAAHRRPLTAAENDRLLQQWVEEEILYREALGLGLDHVDPSVCNRLILNLRFLGLTDDVVPMVRTANATSRAEPPAGDRRALCNRARELGLDRGDPVVRRQLAAMMRIFLRRGVPTEVPYRQQLEDYVVRHPERFRTPDRVRWSHVFLSRSRRGGTLSEDAERLLGRLLSGEVAPEQAPRLGDPLAVGGPADLHAEKDLMRRLGRAFAREVMELPEGRWSGPLRSASGLHLVLIHERLEGELRPWPEIEEEALRGLVSERQEQRYAVALEQLLGQWQVSIPEVDEA